MKFIFVYAKIMNNCCIVIFVFCGDLFTCFKRRGVTRTKNVWYSSVTYIELSIINGNGRGQGIIRGAYTQRLSKFVEKLPKNLYR